MSIHTSIMMLYNYIRNLGVLILNAMLIVLSPTVLSERGHEGLPYCGLKSFAEKYVFISTLDGRVTALDSASGKLIWSIQAGDEPLLSSSIHKLELTNYGSLVRMIPSLSGGLYRFNGEDIEPVPVMTEHLLQSSFRYSDDLVMSGGTESHTIGISLQNGNILYECSIKSCNNHSEASAYDGDVIVIKRHSQTVRAVEPRSGMEKWNYSVGQHDLKLFSECHENLDVEWNYNIRIVIPEGLIYFFDIQNDELIWKYQFDVPIVSVWHMKKGILTEVDMFSEWNGPLSSDLSIPPTVYVGMHNQQVYIQESVTVQRNRQELATKYQYGMVTDKTKLPRIPWQPVSVTSTAVGLSSKNSDEVIDSDDNKIKTTALSVLYASPYINGNGYYLFTEEDVKKSQTSKCDVYKNGNSTNMIEDIANDANEDENFDNPDTPVQVVIVSLWYWWREVLVISLTTAIVFNIMFTRKFLTVLKKRQTHVIYKSLESSPDEISDSGVGIEPSHRSRNNSENQQNGFISRYLNDFDPVQCLGKGGFGVVFEAKNKIDECNYAIKRIILPNKKDSRDRVMREVKALAKLDHFHIVRYFNAWLEYPPPGWQEEQDKSWLQSTCYSEPASLDESIISSCHPKEENIIPNTINDKSLFLNVKLHSMNNLLNGSGDFISLNNKQEDMSDSFIVFTPYPEPCVDVSTDYISPKAEPIQSQDSVITVNSSSEDSTEISTVLEESDDKKKFQPNTQSSRVYLFIQMQLCQRSSLREWLQQNPNRNYKHSLQLFEQIIQAVEYVHLQGLIHRDLKPSNIFFSLDGQIKVGDFGLVTAIAGSADVSLNCSVKNSLENEKHTAQVGTHLYMSPEQLMGKPYNYKVDIYSLGLIFFELLVPFSTQMERSEILGQVRQRVFPESFQQKYVAEFNLLQLMLSPLPEERPTTYGIRAREPLNQFPHDLSGIEVEWHFELPARRRESSKTSLSSSSSIEYAEER